LNAVSERLSHFVYIIHNEQLEGACQKEFLYRSSANSFLISAVVAAFALLTVVLSSCRLTETVPLVEGEGEEVNIRGQAMRKSDVVQDPNTPIDEAFLLAIPSEEFDLLLEEAGLSRASTNRLMSLLLLTEELFEKYVEASATSQQDGEYELKVPPGNYILCLANLGLPRQPEVFPADVYGCIDITVPEGTQFSQDIFWGEAGVTSD